MLTDVLDDANRKIAALESQLTAIQGERDEAIKEIARCLSPGNQNVVNGDLVGSVRDMAQVYVTSKGNAEDAMRQWEADKALTAIVQRERDEHYADAQRQFARANKAEGERDALRLERDSAREQFDRHVEWAAGRSTKAEAEIARLRKVLEWLNRRGGLGHDAHAYIEAALHTGEAAQRDVDHRVPGVDQKTLHGSFVAGAKWWEYTSTGGTMWASDRDKAWAEADRRYGPLDGEAALQPSKEEK